MLSLSLKQKIIALFLLLISVSAFSLISAPKAFAFKAGNTTPDYFSKYKSQANNPSPSAWWNNSNTIQIADNAGAISGKVTYHFNPQLTEKYSKIVFTEEHYYDNKDENIQKFGYLIIIPGETDTLHITTDPNRINDGLVHKPITGAGQASNNTETINGHAVCGAANSDYTTCWDWWEAKFNTDNGSWDPQKVADIVNNTQSSWNSDRDCGDTGTLSFITCPIYHMVNNAVGALIGADGSGKGLLIDMFYVQPLESTKSNDNPLYHAWDNMKNVALSVYVIIFLVVIFGNSMSVGIDAYTIKKTLPRLMAAAILTQFSFLIISILVDMSNAIGIGLPTFLLAQGPQTFRLNISGLDGFLGGVVAFLLLLILSIMALFSLLVALITIIARHLVLFMLVITAPLAFAAWVLPNTQKLFKKWWSNFWRILAMFPMCTGIISAAILFARISTNQEGSSDLMKLTGAMAPIIALAILPKTFKWGGDFVNAATGAAAGWVARGQSATFKKGRGAAKSGYGGAKDRIALNAGNSRFLHGISGGGWRNSSRKNIVKRGQQQARIYGEFDKAAQYADKEQLLKLAQSSNKGLQKAAIGRMAQTGDIGSLSTALASGAIDKKTYGEAVSQYFSNFDKIPQMRSATFDANGKAVTFKNKDGTDFAKVDDKYLQGLSGNNIAEMSAASREHIFDDRHINQINPTAVQQLRDNNNLGGKLNEGEWQKLNLNFPQPNVNVTVQAPPAPAPGGTTPPIVVNNPTTPNPGAVNLSGLESQLKRQNALLEDIKGNTSGSTPPTPPPDHDHRDGNDAGYL